MESQYRKMLDLIFNYLSAVTKAVDLMNIKSITHHDFQLTTTGFLDNFKKVRYEFHGKGCLVTAEDFKVDFNFGEGGRCDGLDAWFLFYFIRYNKHIKILYNNFEDGDCIHKVLEELKDCDLLVKITDGLDEGVFYLNENFFKYKIPIWH